MKLFEFIFDNGQTRHVKRAWSTSLDGALEVIGFTQRAIMSGVISQWRIVSHTANGSPETRP